MLPTHSKIIANRGAIPDDIDVNSSLRADLLNIIFELGHAKPVSFMQLQKQTNLSPNELQRLLIELRKEGLVKVLRNKQSVNSLRDFKVLPTETAAQIMQYTKRSFGA